LRGVRREGPCGQDHGRLGLGGRGREARKAGWGGLRGRHRGFLIGKFGIKRQLKAVTEVIRQINASKLFVRAAKSAFQKKENFYSRYGFAFRGCGYWVPGAIKKMNSKPPSLVESGLFKLSLGMDSDVGS